MNIDDTHFNSNDEDLVAPDNYDDISENSYDESSVKEQIYQLISALKDSAIQELNYFKARTGYSIGMIARGLAAFLMAIMLVLVAFMSIGLGLLLILNPIMGMILATILTAVIFLTLSVVMVIIGRFYFKKLSFPELPKNENMMKKENETND